MEAKLNEIVCCEALEMIKTVEGGDSQISLPVTCYKLKKETLLGCGL